MPSVRNKEIWGLDGRSKAAPGSGYKSGAAAAVQDPAELSALIKKREKEAADLERRRVVYANDPKKFYCELLAQPVVHKLTKKKYKNSLGKIHDLLFDFLTFELAGVKRYSALSKLIGKPKKDGTYAERWIYWPTLKSKPIVQRGPDGPVSKMYQEKPWQGVVIRIKGTLNKSILIPRGHLKSEICTKAFLLWKMIRDPSERHMLRSIKEQLARGFLDTIKWQFTANERFTEIYGDLKSDKRDAAWNGQFIHLNSPVRRGSDPTLAISGMESDNTGTHFDDLVLDDIVAESNTGGQDNQLTVRTCEQTMRLNAVRDPGSQMIDIGTRWDDEDAHGLFIKKDGALYEDASFFVATFIDDNPNGKCPESCGIKGRGDPIWPEAYPAAEVLRKRRNVPIDRQYFGQYFNQFTGTSEKIFNREWIQYFSGKPIDICQKRVCNVFIGIDTASGKLNQKGKLDPTGILVLGQSTLDTTEFFVLDGLLERIPAELIAEAIVDIAVRWQRVCSQMGTFMKAGFEGTAYTNFLGPLIEREQNRRGVESLFSVEMLKHDNRSKEGRIRQLAKPYFESCVYWPETLMRPRLTKGEPYDVVLQLLNEFCNYPMVQHDELLDCHAYAYEMAQMPEFEDVQRAKKLLTKAHYSRDQADDEDTDQASGIGQSDGDYVDSLGDA